MSDDRAWNEAQTVPMVVSDDPEAVEVALHAGQLSCGCGASLAPWGHGRGRWLRDLGGRRRWQRPRRARCSASGRTVVLLADWSLPMRRDTVEVIGAALVAHARGVGHRPIARQLGAPDGTVRGWLRRADGQAEQLRVLATVDAHDFDPELAPILPTGTLIGDAVEALGTAAAAIRTATRLRPGSVADDRRVHPWPASLAALELDRVTSARPLPPSRHPR